MCVCVHKCVWYVCKREGERERQRQRIEKDNTSFIRKVVIICFQCTFLLLTFSCWLNKNYFFKSEENTNIYDRTHIGKTHVNVYRRLADPASPDLPVLDCLFPLYHHV